MHNKRHFFLYPLILLVVFLILPIFFWNSIPLEIKSEIEQAIREDAFPNNPTYETYKNDEWGILFDYPSFMQLAAGPSEDNMRYAIVLYPPNNEDPQSPSLAYEQNDMMGVNLLKNRTFEEEVERVGGSRRDLRVEFELNGNRAVRIKEHVNRINDATETSIVVEKDGLIASFFLRYKEYEDLRLYFDHLFNTFEFYTPRSQSPTPMLQ